MSLKACAGRLCSKRWFLRRNLPVKPGLYHGERYRSNETALCIITRGIAWHMCCRAVRYRRVGWRNGRGRPVAAAGHCNASSVMCHDGKCHEKILTHASHKMERKQRMRGVLGSMNQSSSLGSGGAGMAPSDFSLLAAWRPPIACHTRAPARK